MTFPRRKSGFRETLKVMRIVCEGEKTEPGYLEGFKEKHSNIHFYPSKDGDCLGVVSYAKRLKSRFGDDDVYWCVFDVDENSKTALRKAEQIARSEGLHVAISNPLIELWFLLHYLDIQTGINGRDVIEKLKDRIPGYDKIVFRVTLKPKEKMAIQRAKSLDEKWSGKDTPVFSRERNPSSQIYLLINAIEAHTEENNKRYRNSL